MKKQMYHLSECIEPEGTLWVIEKESPNSGVVVFETKNKVDCQDCIKIVEHCRLIKRSEYAQAVP